jgi:two-component system, OmpR family, sensor histidine kinase KdpD
MTEPQRPNPDVLLAALQKEEVKDPVRAEGEAPLFRRPAAPGFQPSTIRAYGIALGVVGGVTALNELLQRWLPSQSLALVYLFSVILLAMLVPRGPTLFAATLTALLWDYFFTEPHYSFRILNPTDAMMFATYFIIALAMGHLAARLRAQQAAERRREQHATAMYLLTRELAQATDFADLLAVVMREAGKAAEAEVALSLPNEDHEGSLTPYFASTWNMSEKEQSVASWAFRRRQPAGRGTDALPSAEGVHLPLLAGERSVGVLSLRFRSGASLAANQRDLLDAFVRQIALVIDRQRLRDAEQRAKMVEESERLSTTLLNSISHEIRTPIAAINSAAGTLYAARTRGRTEVPWGMVDEIQEATRRLNRLVGNLLNMTRLESGHVKPNLDWCDVSDLVHVTVKEIERDLAQHKLTIDLAPGLPLVRMDFVLMQQVLTNLLLNAAIHTPPGTDVQVSARAQDESLLLTVADQGPGLPPDALPLIFDKFYRAPAAPAGGTGLGLAIVKGFVQAQGGNVQARHLPPGGVAFHIQLPLAKPPPVPAATNL